MDKVKETDSIVTYKSDKCAIVLVAFGSTVGSTIDTYKKIDSSFRNAFLGYSVFWAYTSNTVISKLKQDRNQIFNVNDTIEKLISEGFTSIVLQSLHIMPGEEFFTISSQNNSVHIVIGDPLLSSIDDIRLVAQHIASICKGKMPSVIVAHGNEKYAEYNRVLYQLAKIVEGMSSNTVLCTIEGTPGKLPLNNIAAIANKKNYIHFFPCLLVAGVHVHDDLIGNDSTSWKNILGITDVDISPPLGDYEEIHEIFIKHCQKALDSLGKQ